MSASEKQLVGWLSSSESRRTVHTVIPGDSALLSCGWIREGRLPSFRIIKTSSLPSFRSETFSSTFHLHPFPATSTYSITFSEGCREGVRKTLTIATSSSPLLTLCGAVHRMATMRSTHLENSQSFRSETSQELSDEKMKRFSISQDLIATVLLLDNEDKEMKYKDYEAVVKYSDEDQTFIGEVINARDILVFDGNDVAEIESTFHAVVDDYLEDCKADGKQPNKPFSG